MSDPQDPHALLLIGSRRSAAGGERYRLRFPRLQGNFTGAGDLFAALLLARLHRHPDNLALALELCVATMQSVLKATRDYYVAHAPPAASGGSSPRSVRLRELRLIQSRPAIEAPTVQHRAERLDS